MRIWAGSNEIMKEMIGRSPGLGQDHARDQVRVEPAHLVGGLEAAVIGLPDERLG